MKIATLSLILRGWVRWDVVGVKGGGGVKEGRAERGRSSGDEGDGARVEAGSSEARRLSGSRDSKIGPREAFLLLRLWWLLGS